MPRPRSLRRSRQQQQQQRQQQQRRAPRAPWPPSPPPQRGRDTAAPAVDVKVKGGTESGQGKEKRGSGDRFFFSSAARALLSRLRLPTHLHLSSFISPFCPRRDAACCDVVSRARGVSGVRGERTRRRDGKKKKKKKRRCNVSGDVGLAPSHALLCFFFFFFFFWGGGGARPPSLFPPPEALPARPSSSAIPRRRETERERN